MNKSQHVIQELSSMGRPKFREGDRVRFSGGPIHGRYTGVIKRIFRNNKASVLAKVRGMDKVFHPHFDDLTLVTENISEKKLGVGDGVKEDFSHPSFKDPLSGKHTAKTVREMIKRGGDGKWK